ncbi:8118_t:CDS:2 [Diversispora eburnea]|uniref:UDP-glucuronate decarboxylase n=1 Tax=Diversispora eburnea TaxID=1213867 RepID=A0A9N8WGQ9_9GLOM|nr:8118_t:CDS:2 [Diversispora eburnea]
MALDKIAYKLLRSSYFPAHRLFSAVVKSIKCIITLLYVTASLGTGLMNGIGHTFVRSSSNSRVPARINSVRDIWRRSGPSTFINQSKIATGENSTLSSINTNDTNINNSSENKNAKEHNFQRNGQLSWDPTDDQIFSEDEKTIIAVGHSCVKSIVPLELLRSVYLPMKLHDRLLDSNNMTIFYLQQKSFLPVKSLSQKEKKRILVTGGAGFVGSHLVDRLMLMGHEVIVLDNFFTGRKNNVSHWISHPNFELIRHDVVDPFLIEVDQIYHLACPASPPHYQYNPIKTVKTSVMGTINMLGLAKRVKAQVYGDPEEHPQAETYWGNVNPIGPRACYDEGKRVAETLTYAYMHQDDVDVRVARIFNTFGPRMNENDGRVVSNFIMQALKGEDLTIYGDGYQTRSFQYVHDLVDGLILLMNKDYTEPINLGNPDEYTIREFAELIRNEVNCSCKIKTLPAPTDDPRKRKPDITRAEQILGWKPRWPVKQGICETVKYFQMQMKADLL